MRNAALIFVLLAAPALASARVSLGVDELESDQFGLIDGANVGLITNQTGVNGEGKTDVEVLLSAAPKVHLTCVFSPEHGFMGTEEHGRLVASSVDAVHNIPIYSLYGAATRPTDAMLKGIDTLVFDIQDVGTRFYTYIATMGMALEEASKRHLRFVVLDRPNPIRGDIVEGDVLDADIKRMTGYFQIPVRHGMTVGEIAAWMNKTQKLGVKLDVVKMDGWKRKMWFDQTGQIFRPPSPNIPRLVAALLYAGIGCFEATNVSVGRGTTTPFEVIGAPWIDGKKLCAAMRGENIPGVLFEPVKFIPVNDAYEGQECQGVRMIVTNRNKLRPFLVFIRAFLYLAKTYPGAFAPNWEEVRVVTGSAVLKQVVDGTLPIEDALKRYDEAGQKFRKAVAPYLLYE